jgi:hypothetical protein
VNHHSNGFRKLLNGFHHWNHLNRRNSFHHGLPGFLASGCNGSFKPNVLKLLQSRTFGPTERRCTEDFGPLSLADVRSNVFRDNTPINQPTVKLA